MIYYILFLIIIICLGVIFYLVARKLRKLKLVAVETIPEEKQTEVKKKLLEIRLKKRLVGLSLGIINALVGAVKTIWSTIKKIYGWGQKFQSTMAGRKKREAIVLKREMKAQNPVDNRMLEAEVLLKKRKWDEAEEKCIEALKYDPKNIDIFMALGEIYTVRKEWQQAEETYRHVMRIDPKFLAAQKELMNVLETVKKWEDLKTLAQYILKNGVEESWVYIKLGMSYRKTGYVDVAEEYFERAVELEPKNVTALDYLIEAAIINKNKPLALKAFNTLAGVESDPIKMQSYKDKIDIL